MKKVEVTIGIDVPSKLVIQAFTDEQMLSAWWSVESALIGKQPGGVYTLTWGISENGFRFVSTGKIKEYDAESKLVIDNFIYLNPERPMLGPMTLTIKTIPKDRGSEVYLCQEGYQSGEDWEWYYEAVKEAWPKMMRVLKNYLEKNF